MLNAIKKGFIISNIVCVPAFAAAWDLIASWPTPGPNPWGLVYASGIYIVEGLNAPYVYSLEWNGSIHSSFPAPGGPGAWGLAYDYTGTNYFWVSNNQNSYIYKTTTVGSLVSSFLCPFPGPADMELTGDYNPFGVWLFVAIPASNIIAEINQTTGSLIETFPAPGLHPTGCGGVYYGSKFYVIDDYKHTVYWNGAAVITSLQTPVGLSYLATTNDEIPWIYVVDDATDYIYQYYTAEYYNRTTPASLGRIKALFR